MLTNFLEFPYSWLAANMIGAVMIPVKARFVITEIEYILNHSEARVLVTEERHLEELEGIRKNFPHLEFFIYIDNSNGFDAFRKGSIWGRGAGYETSMERHAS